MAVTSKLTHENDGWYVWITAHGHEYGWGVYPEEETARIVMAQLVAKHEQEEADDDRRAARKGVRLPRVPKAADDDRGRWGPLFDV